MNEVYNPGAYLEGLIQEARRERESRWQELGYPAWRSRLRQRLIDLLGCPRGDSREPLEPQLLESVRMPGYTRERVLLRTAAGLNMPVYILVPDRPPTAGSAKAVIALHGHGYGSREIVGLEPDGSERAGDPGLHKDFAVSLVRSGFLVAAPELLGFGDRRLEEDAANGPEANSCYRLAVHMLMLGRTLAGIRVFETLRTIDYIQTRQEADASRIGMMGISGGGLVAGFAAAVDERVRAAVVSGYANTFEASILSRNHCLDNYIPGLLAESEMPDLLGLIAPRPLFIESGDEDRVFPASAAKTAYERLAQIYETLGAGGNLGADFFAGGHEIGTGVAFDWLEQMLARQ